MACFRGSQRQRQQPCAKSGQARDGHLAAASIARLRAVKSALDTPASFGLNTTSASFSSTG